MHLTSFKGFEGAAGFVRTTAAILFALVGLCVPSAASADEVGVTLNVANQGAAVGQTQTLKATVVNSSATPRRLKVCGSFYRQTWEIQSTDPQARVPGPTTRPDATSACMQTDEIPVAGKATVSWNLKGLRVVSGSLFVRVYDSLTGNVLADASSTSRISALTSQLSLSGVSLSGLTRNVGTEQFVNATVSNRSQAAVSPKVCAYYLSRLWSFARVSPGPGEEKETSSTTKQVCISPGSLEPGKSLQLSWVLVGLLPTTRTTITVEASTDQAASRVRQSASGPIRAFNALPSLEAQVDPPAGVNVGSDLSVSARLASTGGSQASRRVCIFFRANHFELRNPGTSSTTGNSSTPGWRYNCTGLGDLVPGSPKSLVWTLRGLAATGEPSPIYVDVKQGSSVLVRKKLDVLVRAPNKPVQPPDNTTPRVSWVTSEKRNTLQARAQLADGETASLTATSKRRVRSGRCAGKPPRKTACKVKLPRGRWTVAFSVTKAGAEPVTVKRKVRIR